MSLLIIKQGIVPLKIDVKNAYGYITGLINNLSSYIPMFKTKTLTSGTFKMKPLEALQMDIILFSREPYCISFKAFLGIVWNANKCALYVPQYYWYDVQKNIRLFVINIHVTK